MRRFYLLLKNLDLPVHAITIPYLWSAAILSGAVMSWRWLGYIHKSTTVHLVLALSALSLPTLILAFAGDSVMEILFLIEHSLMVVVGLVLNKRLITTWGAVCVTLALIYLLSGYTYVLAILAGISIMSGDNCGSESSKKQKARYCKKIVFMP